MSKPYKVEMTAKTSKSKMLIIGFYLLLLFFFAFLDVAVNSYWGKELDAWAQIYIIPIESFLGLFGEITVTDYWLFYCQSMFAFFFMLFLMPFVLTRQKRWIIFALGMSLMAVAAEDYFAHLITGKLTPTWEGPVSMGFIAGIPTFYYITFIPGAMILLLWTFYEIRMYNSARSFSRKAGGVIQHSNHASGRGSTSRRNFKNYQPRKTALKKKMKMKLVRLPLILHVRYTYGVKISDRKSQN